MSRQPTLSYSSHYSFKGTGRLWLLAILALLPATAALAATNSAWYTRVWQSEDGLPNDSVTALVQTPDGYLCMATPSGLARFDGNEFEEFPRQNFAPGKSLRITVAVRGQDGSLWLP